MRSQISDFHTNSLSPQPVKNSDCLWGSNGRIGLFLFGREEAHVSLEEVREIQYNLGEAGQLQREIYAQLEEMDTYNRTHRTAIEQVSVLVHEGNK